MQPITKSRLPTGIAADQAPARTARAVLYLRVSGRGQLETDYDDDGLSIAGQRARCEQKAIEHRAEIVDEYIERAESAKTNDRPALQRMLKRIKEQRDVDYVILWKVDRFARNRRDDANMLFEIELVECQVTFAVLMRRFRRGLSVLRLRQWMYRRIRRAWVAWSGWSVPASVKYLSARNCASILFSQEA